MLQTSYGGASLPTTIAVNQNFDIRLLIGLLSIPYEDHIRVLAYNTNTEVLSYTYNQTFRSLLVKVECSEEPRFFSVFLTNAFLDEFGITIDDVHTLLDGALINHTIGAYPGGYLLTVTYPLCSSHDVEVVFLSGTLAATLMDSNMMPLEGALVRAYRDGALIREGHTDSNGQLVLTVLPAGYYTIDTYWLGVLVRNDQLTIIGAINYEAACPVYAVTVQVVDVLSDLLFGASVTVHAPDGTVLTSGYTSQDGNIAFRLPRGDYAVTAAYFGSSNSTTVHFDKNTTVRIQVPMLNINSVLLSLIVAAAIGIVLYKTVWVCAKRKNTVRLPPTIET